MTEHPTDARPTSRPDQLDISLLGPVRVLRGGDHLALGGRRQRAVLARLALAGGDVVPVDRVIDDLWLGEPPPSATNTLQSYVSNLRRVVGDGGPPVIERVGDGYRLAVDPVTLTAVRFEQLVAVDGGTTDPARRVARLDEALALWRGPAVADFADEPWALGDAVRLEELRLAATEERFDRLLELGRHAVVVGELEAAANAHPLRERFTAQLVLALHRCGRQAEALRALERTRAHLAEELGLDPGPELVRLQAAVLTHDPALDLPAPTAPTAAALLAVPAPAAATTAPGSPTSSAPGADGPAVDDADVPFPLIAGPLPLPPAVVERRSRSEFLGRRAELRVLEQAWADVTAGGHRLVELTGEAGMGKTRLAQHFARWVHEQGGHVLWGRSSAESLIAYQPAVEALRTALRSIDPRRARAHVAPRPALGLLLPDIAGRPAAGTGLSERYELYESLADLLDTVADHAPVMFVVDDLQWADASTLSLLDHLLRTNRAGRLLVVGTIRRPAGRPTTELDRLLADLRRDQLLVPLAVGGLDAETVAALLQGHGVDVTPALASSLRERTGGNPFFLEALAEHGEGLQSIDSRALPDSVRDLLDQRLDALDPEVTRVLGAAAVIGLRVDLDLLGAVTDLSPDDVLDATDAAVEAGLLAEDEDLGRVTFPHALVRKAMIARLSRNREARIHLRVADAVAALPDRADGAATVAQHLLAAGRTCPPERAATAAVDAARAALLVLADDEARSWARQALAALDAGVDRTPGAWQVRAEAELLVATAARNLGDRETATAAAHRAADLGRAHGDRLLLARAAQESALALAGVGFTFGHVDPDLVALLEEARAALPEGHEADRAALLAWSSLVLTGDPDPEHQLVLAEQATALAAPLTDRPDVQALTLLARRVASASPYLLDVRLDLGPRMVEAARTAGWSDLVVVGMVFSVADLIEADRLDDVALQLDELRRFIAPFGRPGYEAYALFLEATLAVMAGEPERAEDLSARAMELGGAYHAENAQMARTGQQYLMARDLGFQAELTPLVADMAAQFPTLPVWATAHAACCVASGDLDAARAAMAPILAGGALRTQLDSTWYTTVGQLAEVAWAVEDPEASAELAELVGPVADRLAITGMGGACFGSLHRAHGLALAGAGDLDGAIEALGRAVERSEANGSRVWLARSLAERALLRDRRGAPGDAEAAAHERARARVIASDLGVRLALGPREYPLDG